jgi:uncharacterized repeat protein (TIGR03803 family)
VGSDGGTGGDGTVFELSPSGNGWTFTVLYNFVSPLGGECGPRAGLVMDGSGNLYGTTYCDGVSGHSNVFEVSPSNGGWAYKDLYDFTGGNDGKSPISNVLLHPNGKLYGTTSVGGTEGFGVVWELTPQSSGQLTAISGPAQSAHGWCLQSHWISISYSSCVSLQ